MHGKWAEKAKNGKQNTEIWTEDQEGVGGKEGECSGGRKINHLNKYTKMQGKSQEKFDNLFKFRTDMGLGGNGIGVRLGNWAGRRGGRGEQEQEQEQTISYA